MQSDNAGGWWVSATGWYSDGTPSHPHHVHGEIYLVEEDYRPGAQPKAQLAQADLEDHHLDHYSSAVGATCKRHYKRQVSTGQCFLLSKATWISAGWLLVCFSFLKCTQV